MDDYYELLDVAPDSDRDDIKVAYRAKREALELADGDKDRAKAAELNRAWNVLSDPTQRERYDERLAEYRDSDDDDDDGDGERPARPARTPRSQSQPKKKPTGTRAEQRAQVRAEARQARLNKVPTIVVPEGFTMASTRARLTAMAFDLLVLLLLLAAVYLGGFKLIDNHFPGDQTRLKDLVSQQDKLTKAASADAKKATAADKVKATASAKSARAAQKKANTQKQTLQVEIDKINKRLSPWIVLIYVAAFFLMFLYLVPSTALSGQTIGKRIWKVRVVHLDGSRPGVGGALRRFGVPLLVGLFLAVPLKFQVIGFVVPVFGMIGWVNKPNRQGMHDKLAKTIVVEA